MTKQPTHIVAFPFQVRDDGTPIRQLSEAETVWIGRKEAAWLLNQLAIGRISEIPEEAKQCICGINEFCVKYGYPPIDCDF